MYDLASDPYQLTNLAMGGHVAPAVLAQLSRELFELATCEGAACP